MATAGQHQAAAAAVHGCRRTVAVVALTDTAQTTLTLQHGGKPDRGTVLLIVASAILGVAFVTGCVAYGPAFHARSDRVWTWTRVAVLISFSAGVVAAAFGAVMNLT